MNNSQEKKTARITAALKRLATQNLGIKIVALLFAIMLWGYVLTDQNPSRVKEIPNVVVSFDGEAELLAQGLCVRGDRREILEAVEVAVRTQLTNYAGLGPNSITATVSLKNISVAKEYDLPIQATISSSLGFVESVTPASVHVEIDSMVNKTVPVSVVRTGELDEGYWADIDGISATEEIVISGPKTDIARVIRAECYVDMTGRTSQVYSTFDVTLFDAKGEQVASDVIVGTLPTATVRIRIFPVKVVPVNVMDALIGADSLAANYMLYSATTSPASVRIVGEQSVLDGIDELLVEQLTVSGMSEPLNVDAELVVPSGVRVIDSRLVTAVVDIREIIEEKTFEQLSIEVQNMSPEFSAKLSTATVDLHIKGRTSIVQLIKRGEISVFVDVTDLPPGIHELPVELLVRNEEWTVELETTLSVPKVIVTIAAA